MFLRAEQRRLPPFNRMTLRAFSLLRPLLELSFMWIGLVAIHAIRERKRLLEVAIDVARGATHRGVFAQKGIFRLRVIKREGRQKFFPSRGRVTFLATLLERAFMRVNMTVDASLKLHVLVTCRPARFVRLMTFLAGNLNVLTGQGVAGLGMIKLLCRFPIHIVVALQAIVSELALVHILVASDAIL